MPLKMVVYEKKDTKKWVSEINEFETPPDSRVAIVKKRCGKGFSTPRRVRKKALGMR